MSESASFSSPGGAGRLDDGKSPHAFRTIGEVTKALGIRQHVLRYWEEQFPMLRPVKRSGGRRYYRPGDVRLIEMIDRLVHREGYTLRGARQAIEAEVRRGRSDSAAQPVVEPADLAGRLRRIRDTLASAID